MKKLSILLLVHESLIPDLNCKSPKRSEAWITEYDVAQSLKRLGHEVHIIGLYDDISKLTAFLEKTKVDLVFNLLEQFGEHTDRDQHVVSLLQMLKLKFTGCGPKAMTLARDKALSKKIAAFHHINIPQFFVAPVEIKKKIPKNLRYPMIVKCLSEEASLGLSQNSVVSSEEKLKERIEFLHKKYKVDVICEEFIKGREVYIGILKKKSFTAFPVVELFFDKAKNPEEEIYSERAKWNENYQKRKGIHTGKAQLSKELENKAINIAKKLASILELDSYARIDLRITDDNKIYFLEANPNPNLALDDEFNLGAKLAGISYDDLILKILNLNL